MNRNTTKIPLRIAVVVGSFPTVTETFIVNQIKSLLDKGHDVTILAYRKGNPRAIHQVIKDYNLLDKVQYQEEIPESKIRRVGFLLSWLINKFFRIHWSPFFRTLNFFNFGIQSSSLSLFYKGLWFLSNGTYDLIHVHFGQNASVIADLKNKGILNNAKLIVSFHGYDLIPNKAASSRSEYNLLFKEAELFTVNTQYTKDILLNVNPKLNNIHVLPVGLDTSFFYRKKDLSDGIFTILFCGRLVNFKGVECTLDIMQELIKRGHTNLKLEIIGEGDLRDTLIEKIQDYNLHSYVVFHGSLSQEQIRDTMERSNIFLFPGITEEITGRAENQGLVIQEAQSMQLPVLVSDAGGMKYGLLPDISGFVIEENNILGFADAVERLLRDRMICQSMGIDGRAFVVKYYDNEVLVNKLIDLYLK